MSHLCRLLHSKTMFFLRKGVTIAFSEAYQFLFLSHPPPRIQAKHCSYQQFRGSHSQEHGPRLPALTKHESLPCQLPCSPHLIKGFKGRNAVAAGGLRSWMAGVIANEHYLQLL